MDEDSVKKENAAEESKKTAKIEGDVGKETTAPEMLVVNAAIGVETAPLEADSGEDDSGEEGTAPSAETIALIASMSEKDLKDKFDYFRHELDFRDKRIKELLEQIRYHAQDANKLRVERDAKNSEVKKLAEDAKKFREKRDKLNEKITALKGRRSKIIVKTKKLGEKIKEFKVKRDALNKDSKGTDVMLEDIYRKDINRLLNEDIPPELEIRIFEGMSTLKERMHTARKATEMHKNVVSTYDKVKAYNERSDKISEQIKILAEEAEKNHLQAVELYHRLDTVREESDVCHKKLLEKYTIINPMRDKVAEMKAEEKKLRGEMAPYADRMEKIRRARDKARKAESVSEAKAKLATKKRISLDDFRILLEQDEIKL